MAIVLDGTTGITTPSDTISGNLTFTGTGNRITGDFSNATIANRVAFQSSTVNGNTSINALPNGTGINSNFYAFNNSDPTNAAFLRIAGGANSNTESRIESGITGTGTYLPMTFYTGGSERMRIDTAGITKFRNTGSAYDSTPGDGVSDGLYLQVDSSGIAHIDSYAGSGSTTLAFGTNSGGGAVSERMRIDSSGIVLVGATSARTTQAKIELTSAANTALSFYMYKTSQAEMAMGFKSSTDTNFYIGSGSTSVGTNGVYLTNTGSSWNAVSDERMKTILEPIENASEKVSSLRAVIGYYNNDESQIRRPFLIAQDVQKVLPEAVNVQDQETGTLGMSYTDTIPLLVAAIKEQQALITALTARIEALETP